MVAFSCVGVCYDLFLPHLLHCSGAVYCDVYLKEAGFNGEGLRSGSVLVVKTHKANITWTDLDRPEHDERVSASSAVCILE